MNRTAPIQTIINTVLYTGLIIALLLVLCGGILYLLQFGHESLHTELLTPSSLYQTSLITIVKAAWSLSPLGIVELGLIILVIAQVLRIALLACFYFATRDYAFVLFSLLILIVLIYSLLWRQ